MVATPAWPPASSPRLFLDRPIAEGATVELREASAHYLAGVLRLGPGDEVRLFDDRTGEWLGRILDASRKRVSVTIGHRLRERETVPDVWLLFAPVKRGRIDWLVEKATELGAARLLPVVTERTIVDRLNLDRLRAHAVEAAEQCERTALPSIMPAEKLASVLRSWPAERRLLFADEAGGAPLLEAAAPAPAALLVGPEGGFTARERAAILAAGATGLSLGPRILRAETAALAALSVWMAARGDWDRPAPLRGHPATDPQRSA